MALRWGIIGCGDVAEHKGGPALQQASGSALVAVMRRDAALAAAFAQRMGVPRYYSTVEALLADPEIDAVYVATPVHVHAEHTLMAAQAGKHVLVEKPMGLQRDECQAMITACAESGVTLGVAYYRRFYPMVAYVQKLLAENMIGRVIQARVQFGSFYTGQPNDGRGGWRTMPALSGGGALTDVGSHRIDLLLHLLGPVAEVNALADTQVQEYVAEDSASLLLRFTSGVHGLVGIYWNMRERMDELEITGTDGRIVVSELEAGVVELRRRGMPVEQHVLPPPRPTHIGLVEDFVKSVRDGRAPTVSGEAGLATTAVLDAAYQAAREGRSVRVI